MSQKFVANDMLDLGRFFLGLEEDASEWLLALVLSDGAGAGGCGGCKGGGWECQEV